MSYDPFDYLQHILHGYFGVDLDLIWEVVAVRVPELRSQLISLLDSSA